MEKAGYHRSVFYSYFRDIYDLLEQEKESIFIKLNELLPYTNRVIIKNEYDELYFKKLNDFCADCSDKVYILTGRYGDFDFQCKMKDNIRKNIYTIFNLPEDDCRINMAIEFFVNGHMNTMLYFYEHKDKLNINDYFELIRPILNIFFRYKADV